MIKKDFAFRFPERSEAKLKGLLANEPSYKSYILIFTVSLLLNLVFFYFHNPNYYYSITQQHAQVGYNLNKFKTAHLNPEITKTLNQLKKETGQLVSPAALHGKQFAQPTLPFPIHDTVGYGLILGALWFVTDSFRLLDVQLLQILLLSILAIIFFKLALLLFNSIAAAWFSVIALWLYFPLWAMNVQPVRDIWAAYGLLVVCFAALSVLKQNKSMWYVVGGGALFALCQFVRPALFVAVPCIIFFLLFTKKRIKSLKIVCSILLTNLLFFWVPFCTYNYYNYNRLFVGPVGQDLIEGLGEFDNPWGFRLSDVRVKDIVEKGGGVYGTPEGDDIALNLFKRAYKENPWIYYRNIFKRIPQIILPGLPWIYYKDSPYGTAQSAQQKLSKIFSSPKLFLDFLLRHVYIRLFLLLGYLGLLFLFVRKNYFAAFFIALVILCSGLGKLPSHIEYRYLVPYYWGFALLAGYAVHVVVNRKQLA